MRSALCQWTNVKSLWNDGKETDEGAYAYRQWMEQQIVGHVMANDFRVGVNNARSFALQIALRIESRAFQFYTT